MTEQDLRQLVTVLWRLVVSTVLLSLTLAVGYLALTYGVLQ